MTFLKKNLFGPNRAIWLVERLNAYIFWTVWPFFIIFCIKIENHNTFKMMQWVFWKKIIFGLNWAFFFFFFFFLLFLFWFFSFFSVSYLLFLLFFIYFSIYFLFIFIYLINSYWRGSIQLLLVLAEHTRNPLTVNVI